ncbi:MAG: Glycogen synthase [Chloroflexi bacterium]|nr:Glycogen synthase [Chloroflexota bacterium]
MSTPIRVLSLAAEAAPFVKIGGLGDVAGALPAALRALPTPVDVRLVLPLHNVIDQSQFEFEPVASFTIPHVDGELIAEAFRTTVRGVPVYTISGVPIISSPTVYSSDAGMDGAKFTFFSLAALELARTLQWRPHIVHAHDWHTAPAIHALATTREEDEFFRETATLLTVHNLPYLGVGAGGCLAEFGLPPAPDSPLPYWAENLPLPLGLLAADHINTVSQGYAAEILTSEFGAGLDEFLKTRANSITGILNGLDLEVWNPQTDQKIKIRYAKGAFKKREENKAALLEEVELTADPERPLLGVITRMDHQKGLDLIPNALRDLAGQAWQAVILGTGDPDLEDAARRLDAEFPNVRAIIRYDDGLARRIYAGSDMLLIPSRYEPCGLTQMIAMRYGCVPVARATGGLRDTIIDYHAEEGEGRKRSTGFLFEEANPKELGQTICRALKVYQDKRRWRGLQHRGMKRNFSWERSAEKYLEVYQELIR